MGLFFRRSVLRDDEAQAPVQEEDRSNHILFEAIRTHYLSRNIAAWSLYPQLASLRERFKLHKAKLRGDWWTGDNHTNLAHGNSRKHNPILSVCKWLGR